MQDFPIAEIRTRFVRPTDPVTDKAISNLVASSKDGLAELKTMEKRTSSKRRESAYCTKRKAMKEDSRRTRKQKEYRRDDSLDDGWN